MLFFDQETRVDELIGKQLEALVVEISPEFEGASTLIDLVISGGEASLGEALGHVAREGVDLEVLAGAVAFEDGRKLIFGDGENDANGLDLGNDDEAVGVGGVDDVAGIDQDGARPVRRWGR